MQPGTELAPAGSYATGLEDFDASDLKMPRLSIDHDEGVFKDSLSGETHETLKVITLGLVKQRVLWPSKLADDGQLPMCKSPDHKTGFPTMDGKREELFPWDAVPGWSPDSFPADEAGRKMLPCDSCRLKDWGSHPDGGKTWCSEQHAVPLLYGPEDCDDPYITALFTTQRSSLSATKAFFGGIVRRQLPAFAVVAKLKLSAMKRGKNTYYVPSFQEIGVTDQNNWPVYAESYTTIRQFISQPPMKKDADGNRIDTSNLASSNQMQNTVQGNNTWVPGEVVSPPVQSAPVQQSAPTVQAPPMQMPPMQAPPVPSAPPAPPAPPVPASNPAPVSTNSRDDDDDLPF
jgi:hypothetical protein